MSLARQCERWNTAATLLRCLVTRRVGLIKRRVQKLNSSLNQLCRSPDGPEADAVAVPDDGEDGLRRKERQRQAPCRPRSTRQHRMVSSGGVGPRQRMQSSIGSDQRVRCPLRSRCLGRQMVTPPAA